VSDQTIIAFVLDNPNEAAEELAQLRQLKAWLIITLQSAHRNLSAPMPAGLDDAMKQAGEYAERCGYARGTISSVLDELRK
jgi:hypothetical protein